MTNTEENNRVVLTIDKPIDVKGTNGIDKVTTSPLSIKKWSPIELGDVKTHSNEYDSEYWKTMSKKEKENARIGLNLINEMYFGNKKEIFDKNGEPIWGADMQSVVSELYKQGVNFWVNNKKQYKDDYFVGRDKFGRQASWLAQTVKPKKLKNSNLYSSLVDTSGMLGPWLVIRNKSGKSVNLYPNKNTHIIGDHYTESEFTPDTIGGVPGMWATVFGSDGTDEYASDVFMPEDPEKRKTHMVRMSIHKPFDFVKIGGQDIRVSKKDAEQRYNQSRTVELSDDGVTFMDTYYLDDEGELVNGDKILQKKYADGGLLEKGNKINKRKKASTDKVDKSNVSWEQSLFDLTPDRWHDFLSKGYITVGDTNIDLLENANNDYSFVDGKSNLASDIIMQMDLVGLKKKPKVPFDKLKSILNGNISAEDIDYLTDKIKSTYSPDNQRSMLNTSKPDDNPNTVIEAKESLEAYEKNQRQIDENAKKEMEESRIQAELYDKLRSRNDMLRRKMYLSMFDSSTMKGLTDNEKMKLADYASYMNNMKGGDYITALNQVAMDNRGFFKDLVNDKLTDSYVDFKVKHALGGHVLRKPEVGLYNNDVKTKLGFYELLK